MSDIGSTIAGWFGGGQGLQPTDINMPPTGPNNVPGTIPLGVPAAAGAATSAPTWQKLLTGGLLGGGELGNLLSQNKSNAYQNYLLNLAKNPAQLSAMVNKATQPLSQALVSGVTNQVQGTLAERGLSESPGIFNTVQSQALAPYLLQQQQNAQNQVMASLGLPISGGVTQPNITNLTPAMQMFLRSFQPPGTYNPTSPLPSTPPMVPGITLPDTSTWGLNLPTTASNPAYQYPTATDPFSGSSG